MIPGCLLLKQAPGHTRNNGGTMRTITVEYLREQHACREQVELFKQTFGTEVEITRDNLIKASLARLRIPWLANLLLPEQQMQIYKRMFIKAMTICAKQAEPARLAHEAVVKPALWEYNRKED